MPCVPPPAPDLPCDCDYCRNERLDDAINPGHYRQGKIECIDFIEDQKLDYCLGNAVKYIVRARYKGHYIQDLTKALWYINRAISKISP